MATCARCGGYLSDHHECHGRMMAVVPLATDLLLGSVVGAALGALLLGEAPRLLIGQSFEMVGLAVGPFSVFLFLRALRRT